MEKVFELSSEASQLAPFRAQLRTLLLAAGMKEKAIAEIVLAVDEALTNCIRHAYRGAQGKMRIFFEDHKDRIKISIQDYGKKFDPTKIPPPELPPKKPGGLGLYFIKTLMDQAEYDLKWPEGNRLHLVKYK